jgi:CheY-like chemotaxis protein/two-component sensor histidine kinase
LRTPLNPILGWSKLLLTRKFDEVKTTQALTIIERNAQLQAQLIEDLLDVSRILQGKLALSFAPVNLVTVITGALETLRLAAEAKSIQLQTVLDSVGQISGDSARLQQIVWNLLSNAIKFTPPGGQVQVLLEKSDTYAQIQVVDNGKGISADFLPYVFDHFRQADSATTRKFGGLGLGLAIVKQLVELHDGTIQVESPGEGQGAIFTARLPLLNSQCDEDDCSSLPVVVDSLSLSGLNILVVDDETDSRDFVGFVLEEAGAIVTPVSSATAALTISLTSFNVLVSDIGMPEMDGYMLVRELRTRGIKQNGQIPAIALTAYAGEYDQEQALAAGFQLHLSKPVEPDTLVQAVKSLMKLA